MDLRLRRAYEDPGPDDGRRVLVDRVWPRGRSRETLELHAWHRELAPSDALRKWFAHRAERWDEFRRRYFEELEAADEEAAAQIEGLLEDLRAGHRVTLVFGARDEERNQAQALAEFLTRRER